MYRYTGLLMSLFAVSVCKIYREVPTKIISRDYYDDTTKEVLAKPLENFESVEMSSEKSSEKLIDASYWDDTNSEEADELVPRVMTLPSKKRMCILSPGREYCVEQLQQINN
ncbi:uncharacterized protein LOC133530915 [Cydia pomonella]|uniref:uncharacterized protein LOC133530915 n=1 Tax=Cydia pomonella TaxID=82600 RepID=UPI002ADE5CD5|nr:uncharacterized protein LOC133530915 [Cydia pomonella]